MKTVKRCHWYPVSKWFSYKLVTPLATNESPNCCQNWPRKWPKMARKWGLNAKEWVVRLYLRLDQCKLLLLAICKHVLRVYRIHRTTRLPPKSDMHLPKLPISNYQFQIFEKTCVRNQVRPYRLFFSNTAVKRFLSTKNWINYIFFLWSNDARASTHFFGWLNFLTAAVSIWSPWKLHH